MIWLTTLLGFFVGLCAFLIVVLVKDKGIVAEYVHQFYQMKKRVGLGNTLKYSYSLATQLFRKDHISVRQSCFDDDMVHIAFYPTGGLGDYIVSAVVLEELQKICKCSIDVYCEKYEFGMSIYSNRRGVSVKDFTDFYKNCNQYDLSLMVEHFIHVISSDMNRIEMISHELCERIRYIKENWDRLYVNINEQCWRERIQFERCRLLNLDRWTELRMGEAFEISKKEVFIPLLENYNNEVMIDSLGKYITINYGADAMIPGKKQKKLWLKEYWQELVNMVHQRIPEIKIIQLGAEDAERIDGVDDWILGQSLELTKWILKSSELHIDCEGGLVHLATQLGTKCIVLFGPTPVHMYGYEKNVNIVPPNCTNCMGLHSMWAYECMNTKNQGCTASILPCEVYKCIEVCIK